MPDPHHEELGKPDPLARHIGASEVHKLRARRGPAPGVWAGLGMMGLIGWSVTIPMLLCAALGIWLDHHHPGKHNWTLALILIGLAIGCLNAWHLVANEFLAMRGTPDDADE
jgi:ATP synthase protein I